MRDGEYDSTGCGSGLTLGTALQSGTLIEVGSFSFPESQVGDGERTELSESVTVILKQ